MVSSAHVRQWMKQHRAPAAGLAPGEPSKALVLPALQGVWTAAAAAAAGVGHTLATCLAPDVNGRAKYVQQQVPGGRGLLQRTRLCNQRHHASKPFLQALRRNNLPSV
jgi:hypothetical protein